MTHGSVGDSGPVRPNSGVDAGLPSLGEDLYP